MIYNFLKVLCLFVCDEKYVFPNEMSGVSDSCLFQSFKKFPHFYIDDYWDNIVNVDYVGQSDADWRQQEASTPHRADDRHHGSQISWLPSHLQLHLEVCSSQEVQQFYFRDALCSSILPPVVWSFFTSPQFRLEIIYDILNSRVELMFREMILTKMWNLNHFLALSPDRRWNKHSCSWKSLRALKGNNRRRQTGAERGS